MMNNRKSTSAFLIAFIFLVSSCNNHPTAKITSSKKDSIITLSPVELYLQKEFNSREGIDNRSFHSKFEITDTFEIKSLNATIYHFGTPHTYDDTEYDVILDHSSGQFFKIDNPSWPTTGMYVSPETQLLLLTGKDELEPINYDFLGLEAFLNSCEVLKKKVFDLETLDSIIMKGDTFPVRIKNEAEILKTLMNDKAYYFPGREIWTEKIYNALRIKFKAKNVLLYRAPGIILYYEINPVHNYIEYISRDADSTKENLRDYQNLIKGNLYNIRAFRISSMNF